MAARNALLYRCSRLWHWLCIFSPFSRLFRSLFSSLSVLKWLRGVDKHLVRTGYVARITSLPVELLETVMLELEWKDVLRARMTCRLFYKASKSHVVWRHLFTRLSDSYIIPIFLPKPLHPYLPHEVEGMVTRWLCGDTRWSPSSQTSLPPHRVVRQKATRASFVLVDGGRWLLVSDDIDEGSVLAYDLNSTSPDMDVSVVTSRVADEFLVTSMDICIDHAAPTLEFNLAVAYEKFCPSLDVPVRVSIWRIVLDDTAIAKSVLAASLRSSFPTRQKGVYLDTSLLDSEYARFISSGKVEVYNWKTSNESHHCKGLLLVDRDACRLQLLSDRKILISGQHFINVYRTPELAMHAPDDDVVISQRDAPLYVFSMGNAIPALGGISPLLRGPAKEAYISFATDQALFAMLLNCDGHGEIAVKRLLDFPGDSVSSYALGLHRGFIRHRNKGGDIVTLNFRHSREDTTIMKRYTWDGPHGYGSSFARVDEWSGRVVDCVNNLIAFDFSS